MPIVITAETALAELEAAVEKKGSDYKYEKVGASDTCVYFAKEGDSDIEPSCLVGHVLHALGVPADLMVAKFNANMGFDPGESGSLADETADDLLMALNRRGITSADNDAIRLLAVAQRYQDGGDAWGWCVEQTIKMFNHA